MRKLFSAFQAILLITTLGGCLASTSSSIGVNCGSTQSMPIWERPLDCQGGN